MLNFQGQLNAVACDAIWTCQRCKLGFTVRYVECLSSVTLRHVGFWKHPHTLSRCCALLPWPSLSQHPYMRVRHGFDRLVAPPCGRAGRFSCSGYHCATGRRGLSNISNQWSRPRSRYCGPSAKQPISSLLPTLCVCGYIFMDKTLFNAVIEQCYSKNTVTVVTLGHNYN